MHRNQNCTEDLIISECFLILTYRGQHKSHHSALGFCHSVPQRIWALSSHGLWHWQDMASDEGFLYLQKKINIVLNFWRYLKETLFGLISNFSAEVSKAFANIHFFLKKKKKTTSISIYNSIWDTHRGTWCSVPEHFQVPGKLNNIEYDTGYQVPPKKSSLTQNREKINGKDSSTKTISTW